MAEFIEFIKKTFQGTIRNITNYNKETYSTLLKIGRNPLLQSEVFEQAINILGDTIGDMDIEIEKKDNKIFRK